MIVKPIGELQTEDYLPGAVRSIGVGCGLTILSPFGVRAKQQ
jgi:hypothetical protein